MQFSIDDIIQYPGSAGLQTLHLDKSKKQQSNNELMRYAGMGTQFLVAIGLGIFFGLKLDSWLHISFPLLVWLFPLLIITGMIIKIIIETSKK